MRRIQQIDVVRGFAISGLPLVNLGLTVGPTYPKPGPVAAFVYDNLVYQRFLTIFCFLFGVSFALILSSAAERSARPRLVLARRLVVLFAISMFQLVALDHNLQLAVYATLGLLVLPPLSYLPRHGQLIAGLVLVIASMPLVEADPEHAGNPFKVLLEWSGLLALGGSAVGELRLLATCLAYVTLVLLLLRTGFGAALTTYYAPLGKMALTCFLAQAVGALVFAALVDVHTWNYALLTFGGTALVVSVQSVACAWWLRRFRYGPVEWVWRCATWLSIVPMRRAVGAGPVLPGQLDRRR